MQLKPTPFKRGESPNHCEGHIVGGIGGFSGACVGGDALQVPLEVLLVQGSQEEGLFARVADSKHRIFEGKLEKSDVSFTVEAFKADCGGDPLPLIQKDSGSLQTQVKGNLRDHIFNFVLKEGIKGGLVYVKGRASQMSIYGHTDPNHLNDKTKTFRSYDDIHGIEGWGNFSFIDGKTPFIHVHGVCSSYHKKEGGHFIMDEKTQLIVQEAVVLFFPTDPIIRTLAGEDFPTWKI